MRYFPALFLMMIFLSALTTCKEDDPDPGHLKFTFAEKVDGLPLKTDTLMYVNEAGNHYLVTEVQYFISNVTLNYSDGKSYKIGDSRVIHYVDSDIEDTRSWNISGEIPEGLIDSIVFTFGLDEATNKAGLFTDPPESNMFWPDELGGGYHYMKLNGKYLDTDNLLSPFGFHLGIGQTYDSTGQVTGFVQNYFNVTLKLPVYSSYIIFIYSNQTTEIEVDMNIESWFKTPNTWDFNIMPGMMMSNQEALKKACENGSDVFTIAVVNEK